MTQSIILYLIGFAGVGKYTIVRKMAKYGLRLLIIN